MAIAITGIIAGALIWMFSRKANWRTEVKLGVGVLVIFAAIWTTKEISPSTAADVASYLASCYRSGSCPDFPEVEGLMSAG
jgi:hypothetical protein